MLKLIEALSTLKVVIVSAVFLAASLVLMILNISPPINPVWVTVVLCGMPLLYWAVVSLVFDRAITSPLLISIAMVASVCIGQYFAAGEVAFIMAVGSLLESKTAERARQGLKNLISLTPTRARRISNGKEETITFADMSVGDILRVLPGEAIPADGEIIAGDTSVDQSIMTGESLPVDKTVGDDVFCGTINRFGAVDIRASKVGEDSSLQKLIRMVADAEKNKAPVQRIADKWASWLVPTALAIAVITFIATRDITRAVTVLVVFCPCALALATPTAIMAAIGQAAKHGVIIKSGAALESMGKAGVIAFDKTGTLTTGQLAVTDVLPFGEMNADELLALAASAESLSEHPLGKAIVARAKELGLVLVPAESFSMTPGKGVSAVIDGKRINCGNQKIERGEASEVSAVDELRRRGNAVIVVSLDERPIGAIALADTIRPFAKDVITELKAASVTPVLLTGDHANTAAYFSEMTGIEKVYAELLPEQKVETMKELQRAAGTSRRDRAAVAMVGDGVNDAPALKTASVGVAMGGMGSDIAVDAADIALMSDDISKLPYLKRLANAAVRTIKVNISISMTLNAIAVTLSVLGVLTPVTGALVHNAGSVLVVLNAALLYDRKY